MTNWIGYAYSRVAASTEPTKPHYSVAQRQKYTAFCLFRFEPRTSNKVFPPLTQQAVTREIHSFLVLINESMNESTNQRQSFSTCAFLGYQSISKRYVVAFSFLASLLVCWFACLLACLWLSLTGGARVYVVSLLFGFFVGLAVLVQRRGGGGRNPKKVGTISIGTFRWTSGYTPRILQVHTPVTPNRAGKAGLSTLDYRTGPRSSQKRRRVWTTDVSVPTILGAAVELWICKKNLDGLLYCTVLYCTVLQWISILWIRVRTLKLPGILPLRSRSE